MKKVSGPQVVTPAEALERPLPPQIQEALGELVGVAREGLLALSVGVGLSVVHELMEGRPEPRRRALADLDLVERTVLDEYTGLDEPDRRVRHRCSTYVPGASSRGA